MIGLCECGCGERTALSKVNHTARGWVKGQPVRFVRWHSHKRPANEIITDLEGTWLLFANGLRSRISPSDIPFIRQKAWCLDSAGYVSGGQGRLHALLMGSKPKHHVDHINRDKLDNRRENLRLVPVFLNARNHNRHKTNTSGHNGVSWTEVIHTVRGVQQLRWKDGRGRWRAYITVADRQIFVGYYLTIEEAVEARYKAEQTYWVNPDCLKIHFPEAEPQ